MLFILVIKGMYGYFSMYLFFEIVLFWLLEVGKKYLWLLYYSVFLKYLLRGVYSFIVFFEFSLLNLILVFDVIKGKFDFIKIGWWYDRIYIYI